MHTLLWPSQHMPHVLDAVPVSVTSCSRFLNNHGWKMITITSPMIIIKGVWYISEQGCSATQDTRYPEQSSPQMQCSFRASALLSTELTISMKYSSRVQVKEQTFKIVSNRIFDLANTTSLATNMLLRFHRCVKLFDWAEVIGRHCMSL